VFIAFDCLYDRSGWHLHEPLRERLARLEACTRPVRRLVRADGVLGQGEAFYEAARERGLEGVMAKRLDSRYTPGRRTTAWQKFLIYKTEVFWAVGWVRHPDQLSVLLAEDRGPLSRHYVGRVAVPSLPGGERPPEDVMEARFERPWRIWVQYRERTPDGHLRHPVFRAFEAEP
jgi:bifunctional non-homologous end joining protein LigD